MAKAQVGVFDFTRGMGVKSISSKLKVKKAYIGSSSNRMEGFDSFGSVHCRK